MLRKRTVLCTRYHVCVAKELTIIGLEQQKFTWNTNPLTWTMNRNSMEMTRKTTADTLLVFSPSAIVVELPVRCFRIYLRQRFSILTGRDFSDNC